MKFNTNEAAAGIPMGLGCIRFKMVYYQPTGQMVHFEVSSDKEKFSITNVPVLHIAKKEQLVTLQATLKIDVSWNKNKHEMPMLQPSNTPIREYERIDMTKLNMNIREAIRRVEAMPKVLLLQYMHPKFQVCRSKSYMRKYHAPLNKPIRNVIPTCHLSMECKPTANRPPIVPRPLAKVDGAPKNQSTKSIPPTKSKREEHKNTAKHGVKDLTSIKKEKFESMVRDLMECDFEPDIKSNDYARPERVYKQRRAPKAHRKSSKVKRRASNQASKRTSSPQKYAQHGTYQKNQVSHRDPLSMNNADHGVVHWIKDKMFSKLHGIRKALLKSSNGPKIAPQITSVPTTSKKELLKNMYLTKKKFKHRPRSYITIKKNVHYLNASSENNQEEPLTDVTSHWDFCITGFENSTEILPPGTLVVYIEGSSSCFTATNIYPVSMEQKDPSADCMPQMVVHKTKETNQAPSTIIY